MSVQVRRRREAAAFLATYVGAQGELLVDTTNNRVQVHDGVTPGGWPAAKLSEVVISTRTPIADANYTVLMSDRTVAFTALTASRTATLPSAASYPQGVQIVVVDEAGACSATTTITIVRAGSDTINGVTVATISSAYGFLALASNGKNAWTVVDFTGATTQQLTNRNAVVNGNFAVNQRAFATGTALAASAYAHDRWKAGASGCTYAFTQAVPDTTVTINAGTLMQAVEAPNVFATSYWLTWAGTATARVWQGSASGAFSAGLSLSIGGVTVNALLVTGLSIGTIAAIEFATGTVGLVQFEAVLANAGPTRFERRQLATELLLCQRYYQISNGCVANLFSTGGLINAAFTFVTNMRATPTVTLGSNAIVDRPGVASYAVTSINTVFQTGTSSNLIQLTANGTSVGICEVYPGCFNLSAEL